MRTKETASEHEVLGSLNTRVCLALAEEDGVHPWESSPLYETLDPAVLETLEEQENEEWRLEFEVESHSVTVTGDGMVTVDGTRFSKDDLQSALESLNHREFSPRRVE